MDKAKVYIKKNKERFISELLDLLRIPSISAQSERKPDMQRCAEFLAAALVKAGADRADVLPTEGNPVVYAEKTVDPGAKTVLVYGHYDVMPVDPRDEWRTEPFEPVIRDGRIWGRGADDDKGQLWMHAKAFEAMCATDSLPCNVKFMLEGEEEIGSPSLYGFCEQNKELLKADIILVSDTSMISMQTPSITCGLRGLAYMEVEVTGPDKDLHSGLFGGAVANPANVLARLVAGLVDENGRVTIPGFYDDVRELTPAEREAFNKAPFSLEDYKKSLKIGDVEGEAGYTTLERTGVRPSLDVNGIWGGYTGEGTKTVIPSKASAKISMRLVPNQDYRKISELFEKHFRAIAPESVKVVVSPHHHLPAHDQDFSWQSPALSVRPLTWKGTDPLYSACHFVLSPLLLFLSISLNITGAFLPLLLWCKQLFFRLYHGLLSSFFCSNQKAVQTVSGTSLPVLYGQRRTSLPYV